ncbi:hypothetical protein GGI35DRAFT_453603 [Trichoderma velutinum]
MAVNGLEEHLQEVSLDNGDTERDNETSYLLFRRSEFRKYDDTPRYLFRVFTAYSRGSTDENWAKSSHAMKGTSDSTVDLLSTIFESGPLTAQMVNKHLRGEDCKENNLMSWTSSLLYALVYIFHLHAKNRHVVKFDEISLCVLDTSNMPEGVFLRDLDLIDVYHPYFSGFQGLKGFKNLRCGRRGKGVSGYYYFGEYLSQGSLKIEGECKIVSAQNIIDKGLYYIRSEFREYKDWPRQRSPPWADAVLQMRESFYHANMKQQPISNILKLKSALNIGDLFGPRWKLPIAAHLAALAAPRIDRETMVAEFRTFSNNDRKNCSPFNTKIVAYDTLPEVEQYYNIMRSVYRDYRLTQLKDLLKDAEGHLSQAGEVIEEVSSTKEGLTLTDDGWKAILKQLRNISSMSDKLHHKLINKSGSKFDDEHSDIDKDREDN